MEESNNQKKGVEVFYSNDIDKVSFVTEKFEESDIDFMVVKNHGYSPIYGKKVFEKIEKTLFQYVVIVHENDRETAEEIINMIETEDEDISVSEYDYRKALESYNNLDSYYRVKFAQFDDPMNKSDSSWNWCAWLFPLIWLLVKKLWLAFFLNLLITSALVLLSVNHLVESIGFFVMIQSVICGVYGNYWYYSKYKTEHPSEGGTWRCHFCGTVNTTYDQICVKCEAHR